MVPVPAEEGRGERGDRESAGTTNGEPAQLWLRAVLSVFAQRQGLRLESQARVQDLSEAGMEFANRAEEAHGARETGNAGGTDGKQ